MLLTPLPLPACGEEHSTPTAEVLALRVGLE